MHGMTIFQTTEMPDGNPSSTPIFIPCLAPKDDELVPPWTDELADEAELDAMSSRLRDATLGKLSPTRAGD